MSTYKVAQDVEADDKLIGPFSFRQFIYLIVVAIAMGGAWGLSQIFLPLAIIMLPIILFFGILALPLRKDQPMETYLAAIVSFHLRPKLRIWEPDGIESLVEITAPKVLETKRMKDISEGEAERRLSYLADIVDTQGWAVRGITMPIDNSPMKNDVFNEAQQVPDVLDDVSSVAKSFDSMIDQADARHRQQVIDNMQRPAAAKPPVQTMPPETIPPMIQEPIIQQPTAPVLNPTTPVQPVETQIAQTPPATIAPETAPPEIPIEETEESTSEIRLTPDIIELANNQSLSIETISREAKRRKEASHKLDEGEEVIISLRK